MENIKPSAQDLPVLANFYNGFSRATASTHEKVALITKMLGKIKSIGNQEYLPLVENPEPSTLVESLWAQMDIVERNNQQLDEIINHLLSLVGL